MNQCFTYSISPSISFFPEIHTFSAKEKDTETGLSYFGARYYSSDLSIWLSVDPMSDKYPSLSPYVYCANNPIKLVDPNGEEIGDYYNLFGEYLGTDGEKNNNVYLIEDGASEIYIRPRFNSHRYDIRFFSRQVNCSQNLSYNCRIRPTILFKFKSVVNTFLSQIWI